MYRDCNVLMINIAYPPPPKPSTLCTNFPSTNELFHDPFIATNQAEAIRMSMCLQKLFLTIQIPYCPFRGLLESHTIDLSHNSHFLFFELCKQWSIVFKKILVILNSAVSMLVKNARGRTIICLGIGYGYFGRKN